jgi:alpha-tubulin suppressor-like RCC1 family protein
MVKKNLAASLMAVLFSLPLTVGCGGGSKSPGGDDSVDTGGNWATVDAGDFSTGALKADGTLWVWGDQGLKTEISRSGNVPVQPVPGAKWKSVSVGAGDGLGVKIDGTLWAWGSNLTSQLGDGTSALIVDAPEQIGSATNWASVSAGFGFTAALKADGTLWTWGLNDSGELGNGTITPATTPRREPAQAGTASDWKAVLATGYLMAMALKTDNTLWTWGSNVGWQLGYKTAHDTDPNPVPTMVTANVSSMAGGTMFGAAVKTNGTLWTWGSNLYGQLGNGATSYSLALPAQVGTETNWKAVAAGFDHLVAVKTNGTLWAWGRNNVGQLGDGTTVDKHAPTQIGTDTTWVSVSAGTSHSAAVKADGTLWVWGDGNDGALGQGPQDNNDDHHAPVIVP